MLRMRLRFSRIHMHNIDNMQYTVIFVSAYAFQRLLSHIESDFSAYQNHNALQYSAILYNIGVCVATNTCICLCKCVCAHTENQSHVY